MSPGAASSQGVERVEVAASDWRDACQAALARGERFCGAFAAGRGSAPRRWSALFADGANTRVLSTVPTRDELPSIVDLVPAANWDEREAHDLYGLRFGGHAPLLPVRSLTAAHSSAPRDGGSATRARRRGSSPRRAPVSPRSSDRSSAGSR